MRDAVPIAGARGGRTDALEQHHKNMHTYSHRKYTHETPPPRTPPHKHAHAHPAPTNAHAPLDALSALWYYTSRKWKRPWLILTWTHQYSVLQVELRLKEQTKGLAEFSSCWTSTWHTPPFWLPTRKLTAKTTTATAADVALMSLNRLWLSPWLTAGGFHL